MAQEYHTATVDVHVADQTAQREKAWLYQLAWSWSWSWRSCWTFPIRPQSYAELELAVQVSWHQPVELLVVSGAVIAVKSQPGISGSGSGSGVPTSVVVISRAWSAR
jgi:hypothetical protein